MTTLDDILQQQARERPEAVAIVDLSRGGVRRLTFRELDRAVEAAARALEKRRLRRGDAVLVFVPMSLELYVALLAMFRLGIVGLFLDPSAGRRHLEQCCLLRPPKALFAVPKAHLLRLVSPALQHVFVHLFPFGWVPGAQRWPAVAPGGERSGGELERDGGRVEPGDPALVTFTSGSTGAPKAAVRTHAFLLHQHRALEPAMVLQAGQVDLATLPVFTLANLASGVTTVIPSVDLRRPGAIDGAQVWSEIERHHVTRVTASPAFFERLLEHGRATGGSLPGLRWVHTGGAPVFPRLLEALRRVAPKAGVVAVYGSTEAEPIAHFDAREITEEDRQRIQAGRGLPAGYPVEEITLRIVPDRWGEPRRDINALELEEEVLPPGGIGEIVVMGEHVLGGYLGGSGNRDTKFRVDGWFWHRTGDAGWLDEAGRLWLVGRCAAKIDDAHGRLYPFAVESVAMSFPEVRRAAVVAQAGRRVLVVEAPGRLKEALRAATAWARIDEVRVVRAIPLDKRHNAKVDYPALRRMVGG